MAKPFFIGATVLAVVAVNSASAADLPMPTKAPPIAQNFDWSGFYVGGNFGGTVGYHDFTGSSSVLGVPFASFSGSDRPDGIFGGGQIGFNYQFATHWVVGVEADIDWTNFSGTANFCSTTPAGVVSACSIGNGNLHDFGTLRGRFGYAWNNVLLYGTGGGVWGNDTQASTITTGPLAGVAASTTTTIWGWAAGAGVEYGFSPNWTLRLEYLHFEFDNVSGNLTFPTGGPPIISHLATNTGMETFRIGVNYLFNWPPTPVVRY